MGLGLVWLSLRKLFTNLEAKLNLYPSMRKDQRLLSPLSSLETKRTSHLRIIITPISNIDGSLYLLITQELSEPKYSQMGLKDKCYNNALQDFIEANLEPFKPLPKIISKIRTKRSSLLTISSITLKLC